MEEELHWECAECNDLIEGPFEPEYNADGDYVCDRCDNGE